MLRTEFPPISPSTPPFNPVCSPPPTPASIPHAPLPPPPPPLPDGLYSEITTERGTIIAELFYNKTPLTVTNHVGLAEGTLGPNPGKPFYNGLTWCRVVPGLVVQGGDPTSTGNGDAGYLFPDEILPGLRHDAIGTLQMGNHGPDTNGSQFCLMLSQQHRLNYEHSVFGKVVRGLDLLPLIRQGDTMKVRILRIGPVAAAVLDGLIFKLEASLP
jgi:cyclophilin family peptidyl-prolyl cis-trans isomerase